MCVDLTEVKEAPPGVNDMTILANFFDDITILKEKNDDITILKEKNDDTAILTKHRRYDDIDKKVDDIAILFHKSTFPRAFPCSVISYHGKEPFRFLCQMRGKFWLEKMSEIQSDDLVDTF